MNQWSFYPIFGSYLLVLLLIGLLLLLLWVRPQFPSAHRRRRQVLTGLRGAVVLLVTLALLRPTWIQTDTRPQSATVILLVDASRSMNVPDVGDTTRWNALRQTLQQVAPDLRQLREEYEIQTYLFDSRAANVPLGDEELELPTEVRGDESDMGTALEDVLRAEAGKRLAAVFLLGDGAQRATQPRIDLQQPARELARRNCPLYTVVFGEARDQSQARDVAIENLPDQYTVFVNNELEVRAALRVHGYAGREIPVQLQVEGPDGTTDLVGPVEILADEQGQQRQVAMTYTPTQVGQYRLTVRAEPQPGESVTNNNELTAFLTVLEGGLRVLYVDANVAWQERKFIRRSLDESPDIQVDLWLDTRAEREQRDQALDLPLEEEPPYDVFLIGDIEAEVSGAKNAVRIVNAVTDGKGLMMLGGLHSFGPGGYARSPLAAALPVKMDRLERQTPGEPIRADVHYQDDLQMVPTSEHFVTRLSAPRKNREQWLELPALHGANRFRALGDQADVLAASHQGDIPLLIAGKYGLGRVLAFAGDSSYRWYRYGFGQEHKRFWRQAMLWLAQKDQAQQNEVSIRLPQRRFRPGSRVSFTVGASDSSGEPVADALFQVQLQGPGGYLQNVRVAHEDDGWSGNSDQLPTAGDYQYVVTATREGEELGTAQGSFLILDQDLELSDPAANPQQMQALSQLTAEAGGRLVAAEQLSPLLQEIADRSLEAEIEYQFKWRLTDTPLDASLLFAALAVLLFVEWFLRKRWGLV